MIAENRINKDSVETKKSSDEKTLQSRWACSLATSHARISDNKPRWKPCVSNRGFCRLFAWGASPL